MIFKVQRIVLSSVCSQHSWCLGPRFRGALYLRSRRSSNPSSFAFCRTSILVPAKETGGFRNRPTVGEFVLEVADIRLGPRFA